MRIKELPLKFVNRKENNFTKARLSGVTWGSNVSMHMASVTGLGFVLLFSDSETIVAYKTQSGSISLMYFSDAEGSLS